MKQKIIVAIDGFSSCGKSTMAKELAKYAGYIYVDTGAMYRAVSLFAIRNGWMTDTVINEEELQKHIGEIEISFKTNEDGQQETYLNGENVEQKIRTLEVANGASRVSTIGFVRRELVRQQQAMGMEKGIVMDGRDIGSVVFPEAELKIFLTASPEIRAKRRYDEMIAKGEEPDYQEVLANVIERDDRDQNRTESPLIKADDAVVIDNSTLTREEQREKLRKLFDVKTLQADELLLGQNNLKVSNMSNIEIDAKSGFCFGVINAIKRAEEELGKNEKLYCLGDIVHNGQEVKRLADLGLETVDYEQFKQLHDVKVLFRAHGEPPSTYEIAKNNNITLVDASCPVVLRLQKRIKAAYEKSEDSDQILIYGKNGHAEVIGLLGQTNESAIVIENEDDLRKVDFTKNIRLFSQTTKPLDGFNHLVKTISERISPDAHFEYSDTICRQVANRMPNIANFALKNDIVIFVSGKKSSNGKVLYEHSKKVNSNTFLISDPEEIDGLNLDTTKKIGICGATSTPSWLMEAVANRIRMLTEKDK